MKYTIWIVTPPGFTHSHAFDEVALALHNAIVCLGHECNITRDYQNFSNKTIILGAHLMPNLERSEPIFIPDAIIWNLEQLDEGGMWSHQNPHYKNILHSVPEVWDYSVANIEALSNIGIKAKHLPVGYMPCLTKIHKLKPEDETIDVLFIGSLNEHRAKIIDDLVDCGVNASAFFNVYGEDRDKLVAHSKIILNLHYYPTKVFEIVRCSYMMANRKAVVSEISVDDDDYRNGIAIANYKDIVDTCRAFLDKNEIRNILAAQGFDLFSKMSQVEYLEKVIA